MTAAPPEVLNVLMIDDDPADRLLAEEAFAAHDTSVRVRICEDGPSALAELRAQALPDVVILDLNMPRMSGFDVIREIRASANLRHLPVVILSTSDNADDVARAYDLLASSYMVKSRDFPGFVKQIDHFVRFWHDCRFRR
jgi:CheY-like chemotaxis protein